MAVSIQASETGLQVIDQARRKKGWTKKATAWRNDAGNLSTATLDRFFAKKPISQEYFVAICKAVGIENWEVIAQKPLIPPAFYTYNLRTWVGRKEIVEDLLCKLQGQTRLLWIAGISGIGKTTLGECLASKAWASDPSFQWIHLEILEGQSFDFASVATDLLAKLGEKDLDPQERNDPKRLINRLLQKLKVSRYWIQLDSLERLLDCEQPDEFVDSHWLNFLQRYLAEPNLVSRLVLTAQALPTAVAEFGDRYPNVWQEITLRGLFADDQHNEHLELFEKDGITTDESNRSTLSRIGSIYEGHPLVLQVLAKEIRAAPFQGNVAEYWQRYGNEFEQVARELQTDRVNPALYNQALQRQVRRRVEASLKRLPKDALDLLCRSSVYRRPVPEMFWLALIEDKSPTQQQEAYQVLCDRALVEKESVSQGQFLIRQHNLIREITYIQLKDNPINWKRSERIAANLWLTAYKPVPNSPNLETIRGYLEAFDHCCEVGDWEVTKIIAQSSLNTPERHNLCNQLANWGYFQEFLKFSIKQLKIAQKMSDVQQEEWAWGNLGIAYNSLGQFENAINCHQHALFISQETRDRKGEGQNFGNLGNVYASYGRYNDARECYEKSLIIARETGDQLSEGNALGSLGIVYYNFGHYNKSIELHLQAIAIMRQLENKHAEASILCNLGNTHIFLRQYEQARGCFQQQLEISREIKDRHGEGTALGNLGSMCIIQENYEQSIRFQAKWINIACEIGDILGEASALGNIGISLTKLGQYPEAFEKLHKALEIFCETGSQKEEAKILKNLADLYQLSNEFEMSRHYYQKALAIATKLGIQPLVTEIEEQQQKLKELDN